jgi:hypothetical protein
VVAVSDDVEEDVEELLGELAEYDDMDEMLEYVADDVDLDLSEGGGSLESAFDDD